MPSVETISAIESIRAITNEESTLPTHWFSQIVALCNTNEGFVSAILSVLSFALSLVAIIIAMQANKQQAQISLFEHRLKIYTKIDRIYSILSRISKIVSGNTNTIGLRSIMASLLYNVSSKEFKVCEELINIERRLQSCTEEDDLEKRALENEHIEKAEELVPDIEREYLLIQNTKSGFHLLFPEKYHKDVDEMLNAYDLLYLAHFDYTKKEYEPLIKQIKEIVDKLDAMNFSTIIRNCVLKRK